MRVEDLTAAAAEAHIGAWRRLAAHCLERNVFLEPDFALAAAKHLAKDTAPRFLFVWDDSGTESELVGVCPLAHQGRLARFLPWRVWTHEQAPLGTPLFDRACAKEALAAVFSHCRMNRPEIAGLMFPLLPQEGPFAQLLSGWAAAEGCEVQKFGVRQRAILTGGANAKIYLENSVAAARRRKLKKARSQLEAQGTLAFRVLQTPSEIETASEIFFGLEAKGWKGRRGTAFLQSREHSTFARDIVAKFAAESKLLIASLDFDGKPLATCLILRSGDRAYWWKITYNEDFATYSPGVLLALEITQYLLGDPKIAVTDSCTSDDNPMIEHIWSERITLADVFVGIDSGHKTRFARLARRESLYRAFRSRLKKIAQKFRR